MSWLADKHGRAVSRVMAEAFGERLLAVAGTGMDLAVFETWDGLTMTLRFGLVDPHGPFPPGSTVYRISTIKTGRA